MTIDPPADDRLPELYADGVFDVGFGNGMVRIDLYSLSAVRKDAGGHPLPTIRQRVVMSLPGFLASLDALEGMRRRLEEAGVLGGPGHPAPSHPAPRHPTETASPVPPRHAPHATPPSPARMETPQPSPPRSPNFD
ncbi:hypothetical protein [Azospirillum griseum]|uniref:hypothetical protein n=1 Tax=Azospirillum griseum TaxID=2496639 RepID=UPI001FEBFD0A|nr:hypothetical protein [Azospirillum griseum]